MYIWFYSIVAILDKHTEATLNTHELIKRSWAITCEWICLCGCVTSQISNTCLWKESLENRWERTRGESGMERWSQGMTEWEWEHWRHKWQRLTGILVSLTSTVHHRSSPLNIRAGQGFEEVRGRKEFSRKIQICCQWKQPDTITVIFFGPSLHTQSYRTTPTYMM